METDFPIALCDDNWSEIGNREYITERYLSRYMGLVTDNSEKIDYAYTAVFPSPEVTEKIITDGRENAILFVHHPMNFDIEKCPVFCDVPKHVLDIFRERKISIYNLHAPLDANGRYSTTVNLADALGIRMTDEFYEYHHVNVGVIGTTDCTTVAELQSRFESAVGHAVTLYQYVDEKITDGRVGLVAGGGNDAGVYPFLMSLGINTYVTGIASKRTGYPPSVAAHESAEACGVNILAGTHYSTEKFACMRMVDYFGALGIDGEFVTDTPGMADM